MRHNLRAQISGVRRSAKGSRGVRKERPAETLPPVFGPSPPRNPQPMNFHEKALFVKADLTMITCRRSRLRQRPGGAGMAQGRLPFTDGDVATYRPPILPGMSP